MFDNNRFFGLITIVAGAIAFLSGVSITGFFGNMASIGGILWGVIGLYFLIKGGHDDHPPNY